MLGVEIGLVKDLPRGIINDTLKLVLDPLGSLLELMDALDQNNPNNYVHQLERSWQSGDTFSRSRIVGNVTGQVALAFTPAIAKKFAKIPTELGEARAAEVKPGAAGIAEEAGTAAREAEVIESVNLSSELNFSSKALEHMIDTDRRVPVQILRDAIKYGKSLPDPRGSSATMYYTAIIRNGKMYNLEVIYDIKTNTIYHFEYARKAMGTLPQIK